MKHRIPDTRTAEPPDLLERLRALRQDLATAQPADLPIIIGILHELAAVAQTMLLHPARPVQRDVEALLDMQEVAARLHVPVTKAYELVRQGKLASLRIGKYVRVAPAVLDQWLKHQAG